MDIAPLLQVGNEGAVFSPDLPVCRISPQKTRFSPQRSFRQGTGGTTLTLGASNPQGDTVRSSEHDAATPHIIVREPAQFWSYQLIIQNILPSNQSTQYVSVSLPHGTESTVLDNMFQGPSHLTHPICFSVLHILPIQWSNGQGPSCLNQPMLFRVPHI